MQVVTVQGVQIPTLGLERRYRWKQSMIARVWRGWTAPQKADGYDALLKSEMFLGVFASNSKAFSASSCSGSCLWKRRINICHLQPLQLWDGTESARAFAHDLRWRALELMSSVVRHGTTRVPGTPSIRRTPRYELARRALKLLDAIVRRL